jgi:hypothetical protein
LFFIPFHFTSVFIFYVLCYAFIGLIPYDFILFYFSFHLVLYSSVLMCIFFSIFIPTLIITFLFYFILTNSLLLHFLFPFSMIFMVNLFYSYCLFYFYFPGPCTFTLSFISGRFTWSVAAFLTYFSHFSHRAAVQHIVTLHPNPPTYHPIGYCHIARFPTPLCCQVSLSSAFFPSWNLDPWRRDRHFVPKRR